MRYLFKGTRIDNGEWVDKVCMEEIERTTHRWWLSLLT